uniref:AW257883 n=1 Tax=Arundo donax TaxID=35708 RepID=A0A0A9EKC2_ARUDO
MIHRYIKVPQCLCRTNITYNDTVTTSSRE